MSREKENKPKEEKTQPEMTIKLPEGKDLDLTILNWTTFKDRIKFFDEIISRLRLEGTPICIGIFTLGYLAKFWLIYLLGIFYISGILLLDLLHFWLLLVSVNKALSIENNIEGNYLTVTRDLTNPSRTILHLLGVFILYCSLIIVGICLIIYDFMFLQVSI